MLCTSWRPTDPAQPWGSALAWLADPMSDSFPCSGLPGPTS